MRQIVLDTETTGLEVKQGHRLIEVAAIELINRQVSSRHFHCFFNPERPIDPQAIAVHKITDDFVRHQPAFAALAAELLAFIDDAELIIHNASFDLGFLNHEFGRWQPGWTPLEDRCRITDTLKMAQQRFPGQRNNLDALCKRLRIDISQRQREGHNALLDTQLLAQVYLAMTGGQSALWLAEELAVDGDAATTVPTVVTTAPLSAEALWVVAATAEEQAAHDRWLSKLGPNGLWSRLIAAGTLSH